MFDDFTMTKLSTNLLTLFQDEIIDDADKLTRFSNINCWSRRILSYSNIPATFNGLLTKAIDNFQVLSDFLSNLT